MISRADTHIFISSIHIIQEELKKMQSTGVEVPLKVIVELSAMEMVLNRDYLNKQHST